jgi:hypothetical protein
MVYEVPSSTCYLSMMSSFTFLVWHSSGTLCRCAQSRQTFEQSRLTGVTTACCLPYQNDLCIVDVVALLDVHVRQELVTGNACPPFIRRCKLRKAPDGEGAFATAQVRRSTAFTTADFI